MVNINLQISIPVRVRCVQCQRDLKLQPPGLNPAMAQLQCPGCGYRINLIQQAPPPPVARKLAPARDFRPAPKT